jgi:FkbM family methyltransferase
MNKRASTQSWLKRAAWRTPQFVQHSLRKYHFIWQAARGKLASGEQEHALLHTLLAPGDWAIDVGANVGLYTLRMSQLVGPKGRVVAFEPVGSTFEILTANCRVAGCRNVSLVNAAASDAPGVVTMTVPQAEGAPNFYMAHVERDGGGEHSVLALTIDSLELGNRIALVKVDAEGHDAAVLRGMARLLARDHPVLIVETCDAATDAWLRGFGYQGSHLEGSSNTVYRVA